MRVSKKTIQLEEFKKLSIAAQCTYLELAIQADRHGFFPENDILDCAMKLSPHLGTLTILNELYETGFLISTDYGDILNRRIPTAKGFRKLKRNFLRWLQCQYSE